MSVIGYGHFTAMQVRGGRTRGLDLHLARLAASTEELFGASLDGQRVREQIRHALDGVADASVRVYVGEPAELLVTVNPPGQAPDGPWRLRSVAYQRPVAHIKHSCGFAQEYYRRQAARDGFDEILLTGQDGVVSEGGITNVGLWDGSGVVWPDAPALRGIAMQLLAAGLAARGVPSRSAPVRVADLASYDGMFACNSRGIAAVARVDDLALPVPERPMATLAEIWDATPWDVI